MVAVLIPFYGEGTEAQRISDLTKSQGWRDPGSLVSEPTFSPAAPSCALQRSTHAPGSARQQPGTQAFRHGKKLNCSVICPGPATLCILEVVEP